MGAIKEPTPVKLFIAMLIAPDGMDKLGAIDQAMETLFGPIDIRSPSWPFTQTQYYRQEMGPDLIRRLVGFEQLIDPITLADAKLATNALEETITRQFRNETAGRIVNLDAGYLTLSQMVLATTKNYSHRIYIGKGIWAEMTLRYQRGVYVKQPWTYPDYASGQYNDFFLAIRTKLKEQLENNPVV